MASNFHKLCVIGRLVRDPESRTFANGGAVAKFGLPIDFTRRKKNPATGEWEGESFIINVDAFNRENGQKLADLVMQYLKKGSHIYVEGRLKPNEYTDKDGVKVFKPVLVADNIQFLDSAPETGGSSEGFSRAPRGMNAAAPVRRPAAEPGHDDYEPEPEPPARGGNTPEDDIPF